jgi:hypothetical protein
VATTKQGIEWDYECSRSMNLDRILKNDDQDRIAGGRRGSIVVLCSCLVMSFRQNDVVGVWCWSVVVVYTSNYRCIICRSACSCPQTKAAHRSVIGSSTTNSILQPEASGAIESIVC